MKAGIRPINYAWQKGDAHNKTEFVIILSKEPPEARGCRLSAAAIYFHPARIDSPAERCSLPTTTTGCVKINNCSPRSRLIGERRTRGAVNLSTAADYSPPNGESVRAGGIKRNGARAAGFRPCITSHTHTHTQGRYGLKLAPKGIYESAGGIRGWCFALLPDLRDMC
jgi:hypothetical protein